MNELMPHGTAPEKCWVIYPDDGGPPVLWTEPCPFPVDDGTVIEYRKARALTPALDTVIEAVDAAPDRMLTVPEGFWSTQSPDGRMIDGKSVAAILRTLRDAAGRE